jgi:hypothetical protein
LRKITSGSFPTGPARLGAAPGQAGMAAGRAVPAVATHRPRQCVDFDEAGLLDTLDDELGDPVSAAKLDLLVRIQVDQEDTEFAAVAGVDGAGCVHDRHPAPRRETGPGMDERGISRRQSQGDAGRDDRPLPRLEGEVNRGDKIGARVTRMSICGNGDVRVETPDENRYVVLVGHGARPYPRQHAGGWQAWRS